MRLKSRDHLQPRHGWIQQIKHCYKHSFSPTFGFACFCVGSSQSIMSHVVGRWPQRFQPCIIMACRTSKQHLFFHQFKQNSNPYGQHPKSRSISISKPISVKGKMICMVWLRPGPQTHPWNRKQNQLHQGQGLKRGSHSPKGKSSKVNWVFDNLKNSMLPLHRARWNIGELWGFILNTFTSHRVVCFVWMYGQMLTNCLTKSI